MFSLYRVIKVEGKLKISTIIDPLSVPQPRVDGIGKQLATIVANYSSLFPKLDGSEERIKLLESASSSHSVSWTGLVKDVYLLKDAGQLDNIEKMLVYTNSKYLQKLLSMIKSLEGTYQSVKNSFYKEPYTGRLSLKEEAAGKVRVFAMVDL